MKNNFVLIGFMGCGKSTIGNCLANKLKLSFIDTDKYIQNAQNKTINQIFDTLGEPYFRNLEKDLCTDIANYKNYVISTGGGIVINQDNVKNLKKNGLIIYLNASLHTIYKYLANDTTRPLLKNSSLLSIKSLLDERQIIYVKSSDIIINVDNKQVDEIVKNIIEICL